MRYITVLIILTLVSKSMLSADKPEYAINKIPEALKVKANAVIREKETVITIYNNGIAEESCHTVISILNSNGQDFGIFAEFFDKFSSVSNLEGNVYDENGKRIEKLSDKFLNISAIAGFSLYDDDRVEVCQSKVVNYPITIEYSYKKKYKGYFILPGFLPYPGYNVSVESSSYTITEQEGGKGEGIKVFPNKYFTVTPTVNKVDNTINRSWKVSMLPAIEEEVFSDSFLKSTPYLMVAPNKFSIGGTSGSNETWSDVAAWAGKLCVGLDTLNKSTIDTISKITANAKTDFEKAKLLYEYMQQKVRYVSIQIGLGGFQPFSAKTVDRLSYGDCKALSNYMKSLLKTAGIKSFYVLAQAGADAGNINKNFVCSQFNHALLMIPFEKDTLFLECTSPFDPFGYNGSFTDDRDVLVVEGPQGGYLKHTNVYGGDKNCVLTSSSIILDWNLQGSFSQRTKYFGVTTDQIRFLMQAKSDKQKDYLQKKNKIPFLKIDQFDFHETKSILPEIEETIIGETSQFSQDANKRSVSIPFNQVATLDFRLKRTTDRRTDIVIRRDEYNTDTINITIPANFKVINKPGKVTINSKFGSYDLLVNEEGQKLTFIRKFRWKKGAFSPNEYQDFYDFVSNVNDADRQIILLSHV